MALHKAVHLLVAKMEMAHLLSPIGCAPSIRAARDKSLATISWSTLPDFVIVVQPSGKWWWQVRDKVWKGSLGLLGMALQVLVDESHDIA